MSRYERNQSIITADMNGEMVMMDVNIGKYYNIGAVGSSIWNIIDAPVELSEIVDKLCKEYRVTPEQCKEDILPFLDQMVEKGLITIYE